VKIGRSLLVGLVFVISGCSTTPAASSASLPPLDGKGFAAATCLAIDELFLAVGNPDTGSKSAAWQSFEAAIERHDTALLDSASAEILTHLAAARAANDRGATFPPGTAANAEFGAVLVGLEQQVATVRDARGAPDVAERAATEMQAIWPRFLTYLQRMRELIQSGAVVMPNVPCPSGSASPAG
jgi:hypothetical protein